MIAEMTTAVLAAPAYLAAAPSVVSRTPPGAEKFLLVAGWVSWGMSLACVVGVLITAAVMAVKHRRGDDGGEHMSRLGWVLLASVIGSLAGPLVTAVT